MISRSTAGPKESSQTKTRTLTAMSSQVKRGRRLLGIVSFSGIIDFSPVEFTIGAKLPHRMPGLRASADAYTYNASVDDAQTAVDQLETPERVGLKVDLAGIGSRSLACLLDSALIVLAFVIFAFVLGLLSFALGPAVLVLGFAGVFFLQWLYFAVFEAVWNGQTPGKRALGLRVQK